MSEKYNPSPDDINLPKNPDTPKPEHTENPGVSESYTDKLKSNPPEYLQYWSKKAQEIQAHINARTQLEYEPFLLPICIDNQSKVERLDKLLRQGNARPIDAYDWYMRQGSFNRMADGDDMLIKAYQKADEIKLAAASMVYEASIVNEEQPIEFTNDEKNINIEAQKIFENIAFHKFEDLRDIVDQHLKNSNNPKLNQNLYQLLFNSNGYIHDLIYRRFDKNPIFDINRNLKWLYKISHELFQLIDIGDDLEINKNIISGLSCELVTQHLIEALILNYSLQGIISCRKAFPREDYPNDQLNRKQNNISIPRQSFDIIFKSNEYKDQVSEIKIYKYLPVQVKSSRHTSDEDYDKSIAVIYLNEVTEMNLSDAIDIIKSRNLPKITSLAKKLLQTSSFNRSLGPELRKLFKIE